MPETCVFCGNDELTNEHVWPEWFGELLSSISSTPYSVRAFGRAWSTPKIDLVAKVVCRTCNNGWMSQLEAQAKTILTPMILGEQRAVILSPRQQTVLARWALKTAIMTDFFPDDPLVPADWYPGVRTHAYPPDQCLIWTAASGSPSAAVHLHRMRATGASLTIDGSGDMQAEGFNITFNIFRAIFQVIGYVGMPMPRSSSVPEEKGTHRLWPPLHEPVSWPRDAMAMSHDSLERFAKRDVYF